MPKESTHMFLAAKAAHMTNDSFPEASQIILQAPNLFMMGSVSPDSVFNYSSGPAKKFFRRHIHYSHDSAGHPLLEFFPRFAEAGIPPLTGLSFGLGTLCHLTADMVFHPLIHYFSGRDKPGCKDAMIRHFHFESGLDRMLRYLFPELKTRHLAAHLKAMEFSAEELADALEAIHVPPPETGITPRSEFTAMYRKHAAHDGWYGGLPLFLLSRLVNRILGGSMGELPALFYLDRSGKASDAERSAFLERTVKFKNPVTGAPLKKNFLQLEEDFLQLFADYLDPIEAALKRSGGIESAEWNDLLPTIEALIPKDPNTGLPAPFPPASEPLPMREFDLKTFDESWGI